MRNKYWMVVASLIIAVAGIAAAVILLNQGKAKPQDSENINPESINTETRQPIKASTSDDYTMPEEVFMQTMHEMTHQKVKADTKWGFTPMTEEQIDKMLTILEYNDYEHEEFYREALTAWKNGDFSNAVKVHNKIWKWQGGTIGKATGLLSREEEEEYLEHQTEKSFSQSGRN
ncbi:DUF6241 domain-containing protein [Ureibacillus sp. FSL K6-8385]|uniref:Uncharacterized protein n=1 Tax=Ureibacillus terrenus TaxID=118246 RepID=A0A540V421_9BACL|nr:DUF6241 domain-containing protein [Ureibacillus terrenus]MED3660551.1 DUF6241 domain-containing protein [Ureibacillus terrenus]MED3764936.1 DUF6241 domain-containing protein [Ureibacillus terrenus]TQE91458.1 hypothetical protein FKZ59_05640 [Ureibacillus terrenus]